MKQYLKLILVILFPYFIIFALLCVFGVVFAENSIFTYIMGSVFKNNGLLVLVILVLLYFAALICSATTLATSIVKKRDGRELLRLSMIIKLLHIPAYLLIFFVGFVSLITIFTMPVAFVLFVFCCMHFIFCADVISSVILYKKLKQ